MRDPRYDVLFESVQIGPVTAPNRFYQVPHCSGMGYAKPQTVNAVRETNAEGGWGVADTATVAAWAAQRGAVFIDISSGGLVAHQQRAVRRVRAQCARCHAEFEEDAG